MKQVNFTNIKNERLKDLFLPTFDQFRFPKELKMNLEAATIKGSTMHAQPVIRVHSPFKGIDSYRIRFAEHVSDSRDLRVADLPDDVLVGWFAHEMGHIIDYMGRTVHNMINFGIRYMTSAKFRREAENRADENAIKRGFHHHILMTKEFLFNHEMIDEKYRNQLKRYYMSPDDARSLVLPESPEAQVLK